ncbi:MAG: Ig-like domain-containing protein, partial [Gemmatimonadales bacterium]
MRASVFQTAIVVLATGIALACDGGSSTNPRDLPIIGGSSAIQIAPKSATLVVGGQQQLSVVSGPTSGVTWQSIDPATVSVTASGMVIARSAGAGRVVASYGRAHDTSYVSVRNAAASLQISPDSVTLTIGDSTSLQLAVRDASGASLGDMTSTPIDWTSEDPSIATVSSTGVVTASGLGRTTIIVSLDGQLASAGVQVVSRSVTSIVINSAASMSLTSGSSFPLQVTLKDTTGAVVTSRAVSWTSSNPSVATVSGAGIVTAVQAGTATITAQVDGRTASIQITVSPASVASVGVVFAAATIGVGQTTQATATARDASGNVITGLPVTWSSANSSLSSVSQSGVVTGVAGGSVLIIATVNGLAGAAPITVTPGSGTGGTPVASMAVVLSPATVALGQSGTATAVAKDAAGNIVTGRPVAWTINDPAVATISGSGAISTSTIGVVTVTGTVDGITSSARFTVTGTQLGSVASVQIVLNPASVSVGQTTQATVIAKDAAGNVITGRPVTWRFGNPGIGTISATGLITATAPGVGGLTAIVDGFPGAMDLTIGAAQVGTPASVGVALNPTSISVGQTSQATATVRDGAGNVVAGAQVAWTSANSAIASVSQSGVVTGLAAGTTSITATVGANIVGSASVTVTAGAPSGPASVAVSAPTTTMTAGQTAQFSATVKNSAGQPISSAVVTWSSSNLNAATVSPSGLVTAVAAGGALIAASSGSVSGTVAITVTGVAPPPPPPPPVTIVQPTLPTFFTATGVVPSLRTVPVPAGSDFQAALDAAQPGDELVLDAGATYTGNFVLPAKAGASATAWVTIRSAA